MSVNFKVLVAYDGSSFADAALDDLKNAGLPEKVEVLVLCVAEVWMPPHQEGEKLEFITEGLQKKFEENLEIENVAQQISNSAAGRIRSMFPDWNVSAEATYGSPAWEILYRAEDFKPDLIVVGAQGVFGLEKLLIGSVAQKVVTEAGCSVRVARGKVDVDESPTRIILGYDGTAGADKTVESVCQRKWRTGSKVKVVLVEDTALIRNSFEVDEDKIGQVGNKIVQKLESRGLEAGFLVHEGNPKYIIVDEAEKWSADCIFIGATKFNDVLTKYLLGSVSSAIVTRAHCSVEVVRPNYYKN